MRIALGQVNPTVGDLPGNVDLLTAWASRATETDADLIVFPELAITGYPPEDLVLRPRFVDDNLTALSALADRTAGGCPIVVGFVDRTDAGIHNAAALVGDGSVIARYHKIKLPNYGVFDEARTFTPGEAACSIRVAGSELGLSVCEDAWKPGPPFDTYAERGTPVILNINGSPFHRGKASERVEICRGRALETGSWIVYVNAVGGQDELVFDGGSVVVRPDGTLAHHAAMFEEDLLIVEIDGQTSGAQERPAWPQDLEQVYRGLVLGLHDYVRKNGFEQVVVGLSGGIDSAFVAVLAADALGSEAVRTLAMPSPYSSNESLEDAQQVASGLGIGLEVLEIEGVFSSYLKVLQEPFRDRAAGVAEENLQARIRGNLLMAYSNAFGSLVLATGNKSEYAVGYATLYGDMAGGFAPIKDVPKTLVYELARWRNEAAGEAGGPIPQRVVDKAPSAELRPNQKDTDTLPPYEELDPIIEAYVEDDRSPEEIIAAHGLDPTVVDEVVAMIDRAEYKRRQAAPGIKITPKAFGRDRRLPVTNGYRRYRNP
ncbi:MAG TPA: NAD+ synthase [Actinomycetota bacterium]|nr:NAD+ synthase [Actinomycetota bacterium]